MGDPNRGYAGSKQSKKYYKANIKQLAIEEHHRQDKDIKKLESQIMANNAELETLRRDRNLLKYRREPENLGSISSEMPQGRKLYSIVENNDEIEHAAIDYSQLGQEDEARSETDAIRLDPEKSNTPQLHAIESDHATAEAYVLDCVDENLDLPDGFDGNGIGLGSKSREGASRYSSSVHAQTFTDSGYGSRGTKTESHDRHDQSLQDISIPDGEGIPSMIGPASLVEDPEGDDTRTVYSTASSLQDVQACEEYICAFVDELCQLLPPGLDETDFRRIVSALPLFLNSFAVRLGRESPEHAQRLLMYLVHRYRGRIVLELKERVIGKFQDIESDDDSCSQMSSSLYSLSEDGLSLNDKMRIWHSKEGENSHDIGDIELLHDTTEPHLEAIEDSGRPDLTLYREVLSQAAAYKWLRSSIYVSSALEIPGPKTNRIRDQIINAVGSPAIFSRRHCPDIQVTFAVDWDPSRFYKEQGYTNSISDALAHAITITGTGNNVQAATCTSYMHQTWPETGKQLLDFIRNSLDDSVNSTYRGNMLRSCVTGSMTMP